MIPSPLTKDRIFFTHFISQGEMGTGKDGLKYKRLPIFNLEEVLAAVRLAEQKMNDMRKEGEAYRLLPIWAHEKVLAVLKEAFPVAYETPLNSETEKLLADRLKKVSEGKVMSEDEMLERYRKKSEGTK